MCLKLFCFSKFNTIYSNKNTFYLYLDTLIFKFITLNQAEKYIKKEEYRTMPGSALATPQPFLFHSCFIHKYIVMLPKKQAMIHSFIIAWFSSFSLFSLLSSCPTVSLVTSLFFRSLFFSPRWVGLLKEALSPLIRLSR